MLDPMTYRIRIGTCSVKMCVKKRCLSRFSSNIHSYHLWKIGWTVISISLFTVIMLICALNLTHNNSNTEIHSASYESNSSLKIEANLSNYIIVCYTFGISDLNLLMRMVNGNRKNTIKIGHWNGGSSFLSKSEKGREKLNEIENYLLNHKIDILGISEANLDTNIPEYEYKIQGYSTVKSPRDTSRIVTYISDDIIWKEKKNFGKELACNWIEIGKGRSKLIVCTYYREFKILGVNGSNTLAAQTERFDEFLETILKTRNPAKCNITWGFQYKLKWGGRKSCLIQRYFKG